MTVVVRSRPVTSARDPEVAAVSAARSRESSRTEFSDGARSQGGWRFFTKRRSTETTAVTTAETATAETATAEVTKRVVVAKAAVRAVAGDWHARPTRDYSPSAAAAVGFRVEVILVLTCRTVRAGVRGTRCGDVGPTRGSDARVARSEELARDCGRLVYTEPPSVCTKRCVFSNRPF